MMMTARRNWQTVTKVGLRAGLFRPPNQRQQQIGPDMLIPLIQKLDLLSHLSDDAKCRLNKLPARVAIHPPREDIVREYEPRGDVRVLIDGVACRTMAFDTGRQAIMGYLFPGSVDESDPLVDRLDHGITTVTQCRISHVQRLLFDQLLLDCPELGRAFRRLARSEEAIRRVWLANMGQRAADKQAAHLLCELWTRFCAIGMGGPDWFTNPFTQEHLANVLGISPVHMNRVMQHLRELGLIRIEAHVLRLPSPARLQEYANFDPAYLNGEMHARLSHHEAGLSAGK